MKLKSLIASLAAAAVALCSTITASAALCSDELAESGAPAVNAYLLAGEEGVDYTKVAKIEAVVTTSDYVNGTIGVSVGGAWTTCNQVEASAGTATWTLDGLSGIDATLDDGSLKKDVVQVQFWWLNAGSYSLDSLTLFDADGNVLQAAGAAEEAPAEDAATGAFTAEFGAQFDASTTDEWPSFADQTVAFDYGKEATLKFDMGKAVKFGANYIAVNTNVPYVEGMTADITSFKLDGAEIEMGAAYLNNEGTDGGLRLTIANLWNSDIAEQPVDPSTLGEFQTIEITFIVDEPAAEEETTEDDAAEDDAEATLEVDWDSYDADAMAAMNADFVLGGNIDIYAVVGDAYTEIATIEADFVWTPGLGGWCGGAGIGNGAVAADGATWISGPEYGAANANSKYEPDGKATQVLVDLSANPLTEIASVAEDGTSVFGQLMVQNWWNGVEAGAQVAAIRFLAADGTVLGELTYDVEAPVVEDTTEEDTTEEAPATGDVDAETDSSKGSPDTGVEDVAVVAGLAIVAAGAVLVSKKRK